MCEMPGFACVLMRVTRFGWVNASYVVGLTIINVHMKRALGTLTSFETFDQATKTKIDEEPELEDGIEDMVIEE